jgi:hypothetical protein
MSSRRHGGSQFADDEGDVSNAPMYTDATLTTRTNVTHRLLVILFCLLFWIAAWGFGDAVVVYIADLFKLSDKAYVVYGILLLAMIMAIYVQPSLANHIV